MLDKTSPDAVIADMTRRARAAAAVLAGASTERKAAALREGAVAIRKAMPAILAANAEDCRRGEENGLSSAMLDRLALTPDRAESIAASIETIAALDDPVGQVIDSSERPNGLRLSRIRVPLGVVGIIYESRPNVTADAAALCLMAGNAAILRGGSEASGSNREIHSAFVSGVEAAGLPADAIQLVGSTDRSLIGSMLTAHGQIDVIIPRGGKGLVSRVQQEARVPVLAHLDGLCHTYIDRAADPAKAREIALNAKMRRTGVCGATETLLIDREFAEPEAVLTALAEAGCEIRGDDRTVSLMPGRRAASPEDWDTEYLDAVISVKFVEGIDQALAHISVHGSHHTDAIITEDEASAARFLTEVDSAIVMHNASTQFADGGEFGLGAEIGIATGRLHARGPVALEGLTTYKWMVRGDGQVRP